MKKQGTTQYALIIVIPFLLGIGLNILLTYFFALSMILQIISVGFVVFWYRSGVIFSAFSEKKLLGFIVGNSLWVISFLLFIWQFVILSDVNRNLIFAAISQMYITLIIPVSTLFLSIFTRSFTTVNVTVSAYIFMFVIFNAGFVRQCINNNV